MKTFKNLYSQIYDFENILTAARDASKGKRFYPNVLKFNYRLEENIVQIQRELLTFSYQPGPYRTFYIYEPKKRMISAAPFRDRVVHHALCNIIEPLFERRFIYDSYANQVDKGTHLAIRRVQGFMKKARYALKFDVKKYFPCIDHEILKEEIRQVIADQETLWLIDTIIDNSNPQEEVLLYFPGDDLFTPIDRRKGLPIGNLTSQFFANVYLNPLDHYVKEVLKCRFYARYVDDGVILDNDIEQLWQKLALVKRFLQKYRLGLHPHKCQIRPVASGIKFLGQVIYPHYRLLKDENVKRFTKRMNGFVQDYRNNKVTWKEINASVQSWLGHARQANTYLLRKSIFPRYVFSKQSR